MSSEDDSLWNSIQDSQKQLLNALRDIHPDDILISGILNFVRSRFLTLIIKDLNQSVKNGFIEANESDLKGAQSSPDTARTAESLIDKIWGDFYSPTFKYYQSINQRLQKESKNNKRVVELRKLNEIFVKIAKQSKDFYFGILKHVLTQYKIDFIVPQYFYDSFGLVQEVNPILINQNDNQSVVKLVYVAHRSMIFLGSTSHYRSILSKGLSPRKNEDYESALRTAQSAERLLPAFGDARNSIGLIHESQGDKLSALHEFLRSSLSRIPSKAGEHNFNSVLNSTSSTIDKLNRIRLVDEKKPKYQYANLSVYVICLFGYYYNPSSWRRSDGVLINGTKVEEIEKDLFQIIEDIAYDGGNNFIFEKILIILIGGIYLSNAKINTTVTPELSLFLKFTFRYVSFVEDLFVKLCDSDKEKSYKLLPFLRIVFNWLKANKLALQYSHRNIDFLKASVSLFNLIHADSIDKSFDHRPTRIQYYDEDVGVKEFIPLNRLLSDFDDSKIFEDPDSQTKLIGEFADHDFLEESKLRLLSVGALAKKILEANIKGVSLDKDLGTFEIDVTSIIKRRKNRETKNSVADSKIKSQTKDKVITNILKSKTINGKDEAIKNSNKSKTTSTTSELQNRISSKIDPNSSPDSSDSDVVILSEGTYRKTSKPGLKTTSQPVINAEDLEARLTGISKDENYQSMVDSLVEEPSGSKPTRLTNGVTEAATLATWKNQANVNIPVSVHASPNPASPNPASQFSPFIQASPVYPQYQNGYPLYSSPQSHQQGFYPQPVNPQQYPTPVQFYGGQFQGYPNGGNPQYQQHQQQQYQQQPHLSQLSQQSFGVVNSSGNMVQVPGTPSSDRKDLSGRQAYYQYQS